MYFISVTMAKGIGNGFPLAAVVTTPKIAQNLSQASHFNTFGGNPMASAVGSAVLEVSRTRFVSPGKKNEQKLNLSNKHRTSNFTEFPEKKSAASNKTSPYLF